MHLTLSILTHFQNVDQQNTSNNNDERVSKFQLQRPSSKNLLRYFMTYFRHSYKLRPSQRKPSTHTHVQVYYGRSWSGRRPDPGCARNNMHHFMEPSLNVFVMPPPVCVSGLRIDPLHLLAGCRKRRLNQAPLNLCGLI